MQAKKVPLNAFLHSFANSFVRQTVTFFTDICIATRHKLKRDFQEKDFLNVIHELNKQEHHGVVMFANEDNVKRVRFI